MRIISLNVWGGRLLEPLVAFLRSRANDVDIFCFQEILSNTAPNTPEIVDVWNTQVMEHIQSALPDHAGIFAGYQVADAQRLPGLVQTGSTEFGNAIFVRRNIQTLRHGAVIIHGEQDGAKSIDHSLPRNLQHIHVFINDRPVTIMNMHGLWIPGFGKGDDPSRIAQSERVRAFMKEVSGDSILIGDMNLNPDTQSLALLKEGMRDLIVEYKITNTRSAMYSKEGKFADYCFVSSGVTVQAFSVLNDEVSDHLPLQLDFV